MPDLRDQPIVRVTEHGAATFDRLGDDTAADIRAPRQRGQVEVRVDRDDLPSHRRVRRRVPTAISGIRRPRVRRPRTQTRVRHVQHMVDLVYPCRVVRDILGPRRQRLITHQRHRHQRDPRGRHVMGARELPAARLRQVRGFPTSSRPPRAPVAIGCGALRRSPSGIPVAAQRPRMRQPARVLSVSVLVVDVDVVVGPAGGDRTLG